MKNLVGLRELRENMDVYAKRVAKGDSFIILKRSKPLFKISPVENNERWETVSDFTKLQSGGVDIDEILSRL